MAPCTIRKEFEEFKEFEERSEEPEGLGKGRVTERAVSGIGKIQLQEKGIEELLISDLLTTLRGGSSVRNMLYLAPPGLLDSGS
jgi:hypothetical protein